MSDEADWVIAAVMPLSYVAEEISTGIEWRWRISAAGTDDDSPMEGYLLEIWQNKWDLVMSKARPRPRP